MFASSAKFADQSMARFKAGLACAAVATLLLAGTSAHATNLVTNGDFSSNAGLGQLGFNTSATDWSNPFNQYNFLFSSSDPTGVVGGQYGNLSLISVTAPPAGADFVGLDSDFQTGPLQQTINGLTAGDSYNVTFDWARSQQTGFSGDTLQGLKVSLGSQTDDTGLILLPSQTFSGWTSDSMNFTATSSSEVLSFLAYGSPQVPPFTLLTDISLESSKSPVPEPDTLTFLFTGLMAGAGLLKSRKWLRRPQQSM
jgi:opacity protein-like surface antigen